MPLALAHGEWLANHDDQGLCPTWPSISDQCPLQAKFVSNSSMVVNTNMRPDGCGASAGDCGCPAIRRVITQHWSIGAFSDECLGFVQQCLLDPRHDDANSSLICFSHHTRNFRKLQNQVGCRRRLLGSRHVAVATVTCNGKRIYRKLSQKGLRTYIHAYL
jgi:hypothetical protein